MLPGKYIDGIIYGIMKAVDYNRCLENKYTFTTIHSDVDLFARNIINSGISGWHHDKRGYWISFTELCQKCQNTKGLEFLLWIMIASAPASVYTAARPSASRSDD